MRELILLKAGEIALKGRNRSTFEDRLIKNARRKIEHLGDFKFYKAQSTLYAEPKGEGVPMAEALRRLTQVFGFSALSRACVVGKDIEAIKSAAADYLADELRAAKTFKVEAKRSDKSFALKSPEICAEVGAYLLERYGHLKVDVHNPDLLIVVEIRDFGAYIRGPQQEGAGGMPVGTAGKAMLLLSGGIDSPIAGYRMAKRGIELEAVHFAAPPYTSERAKQKVVTLSEKLAEYVGRVSLHTVHFTEIQETIGRLCPEEYFTIIMRRYMMKIAERLAERTNCPALITGESLGQVASQTLLALGCTDAAVSMPVFRPLIGMDKQEIILTARQIDTFETSILPYEDCCTVFTPRHPRTRPKLDEVIKLEAVLDEEDLIERALLRTEHEIIYWQR